MTTSPSARGTPSSASSAPVEREREDVGRLVDSEMLALQPPDLLRRDECEPELAVLDALGGEHPPRELDRAGFVDLHPAPVLDLDRDTHRVRSRPVSSACCL